MSKKKSNNLGAEIISAFLEGMTGSDMSDLRNAINETVDDAVNDVKNAATLRPENLSSHKETFTEGTYTSKRQQDLYEERKRRLSEEKKRREQEKEQKQKQQQRQQQPEVLSKGNKQQTALGFPMERVGSTSSIVCMVSGGIGLCVSAASMLKSLIALTFASGTLGALIIPTVFTLAFAMLLNKGIADNKRVTIADRYAKLIGAKGYIDIDELAQSVGKPKKKLLRELKNMLGRGFFPQGRLDGEEQTLILTDEVYNKYIEMKKSRRDDIIDTTARVVQTDEDNSLSPEEAALLAQMVSEGEGYIRKLQELNARIPGEVITAKLSRLEGLLKEIFAGVKKHPEQMGKMHELMDYYLPTVLKLVEAYEEYDKVNEAGKDIVAAKKDIEDTLDTINEAFKKLLNNLFKDSVWDVTTDAQVLKTMLAQKGLADGK